MGHLSWFSFKGLLVGVDGPARAEHPSVTLLNVTMSKHDAWRLKTAVDEVFPASPCRRMHKALLNYRICQRQDAAISVGLLFPFGLLVDSNTVLQTAKPERTTDGGVDRGLVLGFRVSSVDTVARPMACKQPCGLQTRPKKASVGYVKLLFRTSRPQFLRIINPCQDTCYVIHAAAVLACCRRCCTSHSTQERVGDSHFRSSCATGIAR